MSRLHTIKISIVVFLMLGVLFAIPKKIFAQSLVDLAVHYVEGVPSEDEIAYDVNVYLSVVDEVGNPVKGLTIESLIVTEDSQNVQITGLDLVRDDPINIVLAMDVSGSMSGAGIAAAKTAAANFISDLGDKDRVAIVTFDENVKTQIGFTTDHAAIQNKISTLESIRGAGTCLYDAAFQAIQMASTLPSGRRAVVLFTDGVDETLSGEVCSIHTIEDVIDIASGGGTRTPIYSLGMGGRIDAITLERLTDLTGGRFLNSPDLIQLDAVFLRLSDQLRSQYKLTYKSLAGPGAHTLAVSVNNSSSQDSDTRSFLLPAMSTHITFLAPLEGETVARTIKAVVTASGQSEPLAGVTFEINGKVVGTDVTFPYEIDLNLDSYPIGNLTLSAIANGSNSTVLTRNSIIIVHAATDQVSVNPIPITESVKAYPIVGIGIGGIVVITIVILVFFIILRRRRNETPRDEIRSFDLTKTYAGDYEEFAHSIDKPKVDTEVFGSLVVEASDDPSMIGHRFDITSVVTTLGRSVDNDITFPKDKPVSRHHAEIYEKRGVLYFMESRQVDISGASKPPTFGTFVNETRLESNPILLKNGDVIGLGKRVRLKFETLRKVSDDDAVTYDGLDSIDASEKMQN